MRNKIKEIFNSLKDTRRNNVRICISQKYNRSVDYVRTGWLGNGIGGVPVEYQEEILDILEKELQEQIEEDKKILAK